MSNNSGFRSFAGTLLLLLAVAVVLFSKSCSPNQILFSNDGPLGALTAKSGEMPGAFWGVWQDLNWLGIEQPSALPNTSAAVWMLLGNNPVTFSKFDVPISLITLGLCLWVFLRQYGLRHPVCALAALAAMLNMNTLSHAAWGLPSRCWTLASIFLAMAALRSGFKSHPILKSLVAGLAVSNAIMEGFDVGAIFSLYVAAFSVFLAWNTSGEIGARVTRAVVRTGLVAVFAALCASAALVTLIGTQIKGVVGMEQTEENKAKRWDEATMWSLPKMETTRVLVPGLFGYRMDTPEGGNYWGAVGQSPGVIQSRHSGAGEYAGAVVVLVAVFGFVNALRKKQNPFTDLERRTVLFFGAAALISVLFAWGRHAPFYKLVYALPYFSTIRNPIKFMHPFQMCLLVLFGFGLEALWRTYVQTAADTKDGLKEAWVRFWKNASPFERRWVYGSASFFGLCLFAVFVYMSSRRELESFLATAGFPAPYSTQVAEFSLSEAKQSLVWIGLSVLLLLLAMTRWFSGKRAWVLVALFAGVIGVDLIRANKPWILYYDYKEKYASNAIFDALRKDAYEQRVSARLFPFSNQFFVGPGTAGFAQVEFDWLQHQFQYYNIQSLEVVQLPRPPELDTQFFSAMIPGPQKPPIVLSRLWELSSTRYLLGDKQNIFGRAAEIEGSTNRFRTLLSFDAAQKGNSEELDWVQNENGRFGIIEFTGALPRYSLYPAWSVTNSAGVLAEISSPAFDPRSRVMLEEDPGITLAQGATNAGTVRMVKYTPKRIELAASNSVPSILLYNDKHSPNWKAIVDGKETPLLRANFIMRGIALPSGSHTVVMEYRPPLKGWYLSAAGIACGLAVLCITGFRSRRESTFATPPV